MGKEYGERHGGKKPPPPLTDAEIRATFELQACTLNALLYILQSKKELLTPEDITAMNSRRDDLLRVVQAAQTTPKGIIGTA